MPPTASTAARELTEKFHGRKVNWVRDVTDQYVFRPEHALLGELRTLWVADAAGREGKGRPIRFHKRRPNLGVTPDARTLYVLGGDQDLALEVNEAAAKDRMPVGPLVAVEYLTGKDFHNFEPTIYYHVFGSTEDGALELLEDWQRQLINEETGRGPVPLLSYDVLNQRFSIDGGAYTVRREGIVF